MVKAFHRAGLEVILDVGYNHTAEGDARGPTFGLRGLDNATYYLRDADGGYANYSGCGNTLNANHAVVRRLILDSLRYWVQVMHVDGFRFDLASILSRDEHGHPVANPPLLWDIESDPVLADTKLIAEAWDAAGLYQVGRFVGERWKEWNGRFRDDVRAFVCGDAGMVPVLADRLLGSPDLYGARPREPSQSINFVTSHDGFTLEDLVSYDRKHNEANGEDNRDGSDDNRSWNCGAEGPTDDPAVLALRTRQVKNLLAITILSLGTPMLLMGDEMRRSQGGNNNAYAQDNETSWIDWGRMDAGLLAFAERLARLRRALPVLRQRRFLHARNRPSDRNPDVIWRRADGTVPQSEESHDPAFRCLCVELRMAAEGGDPNPEAVFAVFNTGPATLLHLPDTAPGWELLLDTTRPDLPEGRAPLASFTEAPAHCVLLFRSQTGKPNGV
jgi:glycogen operon protein